MIMSRGNASMSILLLSSFCRIHLARKLVICGVETGNSRAEEKSILAIS